MNILRYTTVLVISMLFLGVVWSSEQVGFRGSRTAAREALLPKGRPAVKNVHQLHDSKTPGCSGCHPGARGSRWASDRLVPAMELCGPCHEVARNVSWTTPFEKACETCHGPLPAGERPKRSEAPRPNIRFSHRAHESNGVTCLTCHPGNGAKPKGIPAGATPTMRQCYGCHQRSKKAAADCRVCHIVHKDGRLVTRWRGVDLIPPVWLKGPTHGVEWAGSHARVAGSDSRFCAACHRESFCRDCHSGRRRPRKIHPGDWQTTHGLNTRLDTPRCRGCHRKQSFCITCHRRSGVAPDSPSGARPRGGAGRYHNRMDTRTLMRRARSDITTCISCHAEGKCITCHARQNPHPPGFRRRCGALAKRNRRACGKCHRDSAWRRCR